MSISVLIIGESGTGKSASMRSLDPTQTTLIQSVRKPLPFRAKGWSNYDKEKNKSGNIFATDSPELIMRIINGATTERVVIDDFQYVLANEFMRRSHEKGYDKFTDIGRNAWDILTAAANANENKRVYFLAHSNTGDDGTTRMKSIGKLLDDKICPEGLFTIVLRTRVIDGEYKFSTRNNGSDTVKSPMGLFSDQFIPNDLAEVDRAIVNYYATEDVPL